MTRGGVFEGQTTDDFLWRSGQDPFSQRSGSTATLLGCATHALQYLFEGFELIVRLTLRVDLRNTSYTPQSFPPPPP